MQAIRTIQRVLALPGVAERHEQRILMPARGASNEDLRITQSALGFPFRQDHVALLKQWNGFCLGILRMFGIGVVDEGIPDLLSWQTIALERPPQFVLIASDDVGFAYLQSPSGEIFESDSDGDPGPNRIAADLDDFFGRRVFGADAHYFLGDALKQELMAAKIVVE